MKYFITSGPGKCFITTDMITDQNIAGFTTTKKKKQHFFKFRRKLLGRKTAS